MERAPHSRGRKRRNTSYADETQDEICKTPNYFAPLASSAPSKLPCYPIMPELDNRPPLPAYDVDAVLPGDEFVKLWHRDGRAVYRRKRTRREAKCRPAFAWRAMIVAFTAAHNPRKPKSHTPIKSAEAIGAAGLRREAHKAWARKPKIFRRPFDRWDAPEPGYALKRQAETAELVNAFFANGGSMSFYHSHLEGELTMDSRRIDLWRDGNDSWRVEMIDGDVADAIGYFSDFDSAQRFTLAAAKLWRTELRLETKAA